MKKWLTSLVFGALACANVNGHKALSPFEELRQNSNPTILIENTTGRQVPIRFRTQEDSLGTVENREKRCFEIRQRQEGKTIISFEYWGMTFQTPPFNPRHHAGGWYLKIDYNPAEDVMLIQPMMRCDANRDYTIF